MGRDILLYGALFYHQESTEETSLVVEAAPTTYQRLNSSSSSFFAPYSEMMPPLFKYQKCINEHFKIFVCFVFIENRSHCVALDVL